MRRWSGFMSANRSDLVAPASGFPTLFAAGPKLSDITKDATETSGIENKTRLFWPFLRTMIWFKYLSASKLLQK